MNTTQRQGRNRSGAFLLILPGAAVAGLGIGLALAQPGFGLITGFGAGLFLWGLIVALKSPNS